MTENAILHRIKYTLKRIKAMSNIQLFRSNDNTDADMKAYERNLFRHRLRNAVIAACVSAAVILCAFLLWRGVQNRTFETFVVVKLFERSDRITTQYW